MSRPYRKPADRPNRAEAPARPSPGKLVPAAPQLPAPTAEQVAVRADGAKVWALVASAPVDGYIGHRRPAGDRHAGLFAYPFSSRSKAVHAAAATGRSVIV